MSENIVQSGISSCNNLKASGTQLECQASIKCIIRERKLNLCKIYYKLYYGCGKKIVSVRYLDCKESGPISAVEEALRKLFKNEAKFFCYKATAMLTDFRVLLMLCSWRRK